MVVNKTHIASTGVGAGFLGLGVSLLMQRFHLSLTGEQMAWLVGALPGVGMGALAALQVIFPKLIPVVDAVKKVEDAAETPTTPATPAA